jgi:hypothetical protein
MAFRGQDGDAFDDDDDLAPRSPALFCFWGSPSPKTRRNSGVSISSGRPNPARLGLVVPNPKKKRNSACSLM